MAALLICIMSLLEMRVPTIGESVTEVTVASFLVEDGDYVELDQPILEFDSDKATLELPAEAAGTVHFKVEEGDDLAIGDLVCTIDTSASAAAPAPAAAPAATPQAEVKESAAATPTPAADATYASGHPSPAAAKLMSEHGLSANEVKGTGKDGRILKEDVERAIANKKAAPKAAPAPAKAAAKTTTAPAVPRGPRNEEVKKMSRMRKTISKRLVAAKNTTAMLTTFNEVDLTEVIAIRKKYKEAFKEKHEIGLGYMSFFSRACAIALLDFPDVNAYINDEEGTITYHDYVDISIAVSTPKGLVVPVMRDVHKMGMKEVEQTVKDLAIKGRDGKLTMAEMTGGTFTITNGGIFGSMLSTPILNQPQSAILGMHNIMQRPMAINGEVQIRPMMYLALSYDHRIVDGKGAVSFLVRVKQLLEEPMKLFLDL